MEDKKRNSINVWYFVIVAFVMQLVFELGRGNPKNYEDYGYIFGRTIGLIGFCFIAPLVVSIIVRLFTGKWLSGKKFAYGVLGVFIFSFIIGL